MPCVRQRWCWSHFFSRPQNLYLPAYLYIYIYYLWPKFIIFNVDLVLKLSSYTKWKRFIWSIFICLKWFLKFPQYYILSSTTIYCRSIPLTIWNHKKWTRLVQPLDTNKQTNRQTTMFWHIWIILLKFFLFLLLTFEIKNMQKMNKLLINVYFIVLAIYILKIQYVIYSIIYLQYKYHEFEYLLDCSQNKKWSLKKVKWLFIEVQNRTWMDEFIKRWRGYREDKEVIEVKSSRRSRGKGGLWD